MPLKDEMVSMYIRRGGVVESEKTVGDTIHDLNDRYFRLDEAKCERDFEKQKKDWLKDADGTDKLFKEAAKTVDDWDAQVKKCDEAVKTEDDKIEQKKKELQAVNDKIDEINKSIKEYNDTIIGKI